MEEQLNKKIWDTPEGKAALSYANNNLALAKAFIAGTHWAKGEPYIKCTMNDEALSRPPEPETTFDPLETVSYDDEHAEESFELWWNLYGKKRGRKKTFQKWLKMTQKKRHDCIAATPAYVKSTPDIQYRKDPQTYLNGECYYDEIFTSKNEQQQYNPYAKAASILAR